MEIPANCSELTSTTMATEVPASASQACRSPPNAMTTSLSVPSLYWKSR